MKTLHSKTVVVAGGTGNVGYFMVRGLLKHGAAVAVMSRSEEKLAHLRGLITGSGEVLDSSKLYTFAGDISDDADAMRLSREIREVAGEPDAVLASLGHWHSVPSILSATRADFDAVLDDYLFAHLAVARSFLPGLRETEGTYVLVNGPLAFDIRPGYNAELVSIVTAAQHMLFRALAQELEASPARVVELVNYAFIRDHQTQPGSSISGEAVGDYIAHLLSGAAGDIHGKSIHLRSVDQLQTAGLAS